MKLLIKKLISSTFFTAFLKVVALILGYDRLIFESKYFKAGCLDGPVWLLKSIWFQRVLGFNRFSPYPTTFSLKISSFNNLTVHPDSINNFQSPGCYFQNFSANIKIGKDVYIGPNVGLITCNHEVSNPNNHSDAKDIIIDDGVWIGMNSVIMPGVHLRKGSVVAANSVVTRSHDAERVILAGAPAVIRKAIAD